MYICIILYVSVQCALLLSDHLSQFLSVLTVSVNMQ